MIIGNIHRNGPPEHWTLTLTENWNMITIGAENREIFDDNESEIIFVWWSEQWLHYMGGQWALRAISLDFSAHPRGSSAISVLLFVCFILNTCTTMFDPPPSRKYEGHQHQIETHFVLSVEYSIFPLFPWMALTSPCEWASNEDSPFESNDVNPSPSLPGMVHKSFPPLRPLTATVAQEKKEKTALSSHYLQIGWVLQMVRRTGNSRKKYVYFKSGETFIVFSFC